MRCGKHNMAGAHIGYHLREAFDIKIADCLLIRLRGTYLWLGFAGPVEHQPVSVRHEPLGAR